MKQFWKDMGIAFVLGLIVPAVLLAGIASIAGLGREIPELTESILVTEYADPTEAGASAITVSVLLEDGDIVQLPLNDYLTNVVLAEMPVSFHEEALKAQTVVARTYTIRAANGKSKHGEAAVCISSDCCQAYITDAAYMEKGGSVEDIHYIHQIVNETESEVLVYEGGLIEATYFSCSGGFTEDAVAVWGTDVPYLQSVESPGEENATYYTDSVQFSSTEFAEILEIELSGEPASWISNICYTEGGGVETVEIGGESFTGTQLRKLLDLRSTAFTMVPREDSVVIHTRGYGHRVGMSQYGADAMAQKGSAYPEILAYYYQGTELVQYAD